MPIFQTSFFNRMGRFSKPFFQNPFFRVFSKSPLKKEDSFILIGAGPAGICAHETLVKLGVDPNKITHLEKRADIGGKCRTYKNKTAKAEYGAEWVAPFNYANIIKEIKDHQVATEKVLPGDPDGMPFVNELAEKSMFGKLMMMSGVMAHVIKYVRHAAYYQYCMSQTSTQLPTDFYRPFSEYAKKHRLTYMIELLKPVVPGCGYGSLEIIPAHLVFAYTGKSIPLAMIASYMHIGYPILGIQDGYQHLMEKMASHYPIITSANVTQIERTTQYVEVSYTVGNKKSTVKADRLIIATSPLQWKRLGMQMTTLERICSNKVEISRYPVAIVSIRGIDPKLYFFNDALEHKNFTGKGQGEIALVSTSDEGEGIRLCSVLQNLPRRSGDSPPVDKKQERELFMKKLRELAEKQGWEIIKVHDYTVWDDYMPTLSQELSSGLELAQMHPATRTGYCTSVLRGGFEDVEKTFEVSKRTVLQMFGLEYNEPRNYLDRLFYGLFNRPAPSFNNPTRKAETESLVEVTPRRP